MVILLTVLLSLRMGVKSVVNEKLLFAPDGKMKDDNENENNF
jgi:hypothetical protein